MTGAVSSLDGKELESRPVQNVGQALQGMIPGLNLQTTGLGGELNQNLSVNIRGAGTIGVGSSSSVLVLIDGMEGNMNALILRILKISPYLKMQQLLLFTGQGHLLELSSLQQNLENRVR